MLPMRTKEILVILAAAALATGAFGQSIQLIGKPAPELKVQAWLNTPAGNMSLAKLKGKVVVMDFWAYW
jgi:hypothetical protein